MYELNAFFKATAPVTKTRKVRAASIKVGSAVKIFGQTGIVAGRCEKYANAWVVEFPGAPLRSYGRDMIELA